MIILTMHNTNKKVYVDEKEIARVTDGHDLVGSNSFPYTNVTIYDHGKENVIRVIESARLIGKLIKEAIQRESKYKKEKNTK